MTEQEIKDGLQKVIEETLAIDSYIADDNTLISKINTLSQPNRQKLYNYYTSRASGPIADVREFVAEKLLAGVITLKEVYNNIEQQKAKKPSAFRSYKKLYSILYPFITVEHESMRSFLDNFLNQLVSDLNLKTDAAKPVLFDFQGPRQQGSSRLWFAIYNKARADQSESKQIFGDFQHGTFSYGLYIHSTKQHFNRISITDTQHFSYQEMLTQLQTAATEIKNDVPDHSKLKTIDLADKKLYKISHGSFKGSGDAETLEEFKKRHWIVLHETTGYGHNGGDGEIFKTGLSIGDYIYITIGGNYLYNIAKVISDWDYIPQEIVNDEEGWLFREVEYVQEPVDSSLDDLKDYRTKTYPSYTHPLAEITGNVLEEMNETLFIPHYNIKFIQNNQPQTQVNRMPSLNTILYGPPGTGKTYNTIIKAAQIVSNSNHQLLYADAKKIYESLLGDQIEFITFHQNYSYEDFVLGLRPNLERDQLIFKQHKGIFYEIAKRARDNYSAYKEGLHPTEPSFQKVLLEFLKPLQNKQPVTVKMDVGGKSFQITERGAGFLDFKMEGSDETESLNIATLEALYTSRISTNTEGKHIYYTPIQKELEAIAGRLKRETVKTELKRYVLIIDEINRANISRVFGELITLIEKDKRLGENHEMEVKLADGTEKFSVPQNLYLLGTMNTADKSIALIDIALRRRFVFEPMYPTPQLIDELVKPPFNEFLKTLNSQILEKKGADFLIGHSYLMADDGEELDFLTAMNQRIIPLLNEYFYNQRGDFVLQLLQTAIAKVAGYVVEKDDYVGVVCKQS